MSEPGAEPLRILLVDDAEEIRQLIRFVLDGSDRLEVVGEAANGPDCLTLVSELTPDVILLDLSLPGMDGLEVLHRLKSQDHAAAVVVLSGYSADVMAGPSIAAGALGYIEKGVRPRALLATLLDLVDGHVGGATVRAGPELAPTPAAEPRRDAQAWVVLSDPTDEATGLVAASLADLGGQLALAQGLLDAATMPLDQAIATPLGEVRLALARAADLAAAAARLLDTVRERPALSPVEVIGAVRGALADAGEGRDPNVLAAIGLDGPDLRVVADAALLRRLLAILLSHALDNGTAPVAVRWRRSGDRALIELEDAGPPLRPLRGSLRGSLTTSAGVGVDGDRLDMPRDRDERLLLGRSLAITLGGRLLTRETEHGGAALAVELSVA